MSEFVWTWLTIELSRRGVELMPGIVSEDQSSLYRPIAYYTLEPI